MTTQEQGIEQIVRLARHAERRIRLDRALRVGAKALSAALLVSVVDVALRKVGVLPERAARLVLELAGVGVVAAVAAAWAWRLPARAGATALDRFHALHDRLSNALAFAATPDRTPFMDAAIDDAVSVLASGRARPELAVPLGVPRALGAAAGLAGVLALVLLFEVRSHVVVAHAKTIEPVEMAPDDLEGVKDFLAQLQQKDTSDDAKAAIDEFNRLVDDIASKRLDRTEAFRRMQTLEDKLLSGTAADKKALERQLDAIGEELKKADLTRPAGDAMADKKLDRARDAMRELAKKMRSASQGAGTIDKAQLDQMREAIKKAAEQAEKRQKDLDERRKNLADEILKRKEQMADGGGSDEERSLLEKKQRELERLDRDAEGARSGGRQLDRLDRELEQAAEDLMHDLGASADDLDKGAEDLNHMQEEQQSDQEKEELKQKLQEMRELLRQQGQQGGQGQIVRLRRFGQMARGQGGQGGQGGQQGQGQQGGDPQGQGQQGQQGGDPQGQGGGQGAGQGGSQGGGQGGETWVLGPNGEKMLMLSRGQGGSGAGQSGSGDGPGRGGHWGEGHDPNVQGKATNPGMGTQDTQVQGSDTGQGGSRSQVILGASERGFTSRGYKKVYTEYHQVAEESVAKDTIPGGYRFYVKRYFELIRPREAGE